MADVYNAMYGCIACEGYIRMDAWMYGCKYVWMYGCMDAWVYGCIDVRMHGCMDVLMYGCVYMFKNAHIHNFDLSTP